MVLPKRFNQKHLFSIKFNRLQQIVESVLGAEVLIFGETC